MPSATLLIVKLDIMTISITTQLRYAKRYLFMLIVVMVSVVMLSAIMVTVLARENFFEILNEIAFCIFTVVKKDLTLS